MIRRNSVALLLLVAASIAPAAHGKDKPTSPQSTDAAGTIGDEHRRLNELAGLWSVKQSLWLVPGQPPQVDTGTALFTPVLGSRHLQQDLRVNSVTPFQGLGYIGYDNTTGAYYTSWMDINFTGVLLLYGEYDASTSVYRFRGEMPDKGGKSVPTREELNVSDRNHLVARYYETRRGQERLVVELEYSRP